MNEDEAAKLAESAIHRASVAATLEAAMREAVVLLQSKMSFDFGVVDVTFTLTCEYEGPNARSVVVMRADGVIGEGEVTLHFPTSILLDKKHRAAATVALARKAHEAFMKAKGSAS